MEYYELDDPAVLQLSYAGIHELTEADLNEKRYQIAEYIYLTRNCLKTIPKNINKLAVLRILHIVGNELVSLPEEIGELASLEVLNVESNCLTSIPNSIGQLKALKKLQVSNNLLQYLPKELGNLQNLETLEASRNDLTSIPVEIGNCTELRILALDRNKLKTLPRHIGALKKLLELSLAGNCLLYLPQGISWVNLKSLILDSNPRLSALPYVGNKRTSDRVCYFSYKGILKKTALHKCPNSIIVGNTTVFLPEEIHELCIPTTNSVPRLLELAMRMVSHFLCNNKDACKLRLPADLQDALTSPTAMCDHCSTNIFRSAFPVVMQDTINGFLYYVLCCSINCVHNFCNTYWPGYIRKFPV